MDAAVIWRILERLVAEHVQRRSAQLSRLQRRHHRSVVEQLAAGAVHQPRALLHLREVGGVDHALGLRRESDVQADVVGLGEQLVQRHQRDLQLLREAEGDVGIVRDDLHAERDRALGDLDANLAQPDDAQGLALEFGALQGFLFPLAGMRRGVGLGKMARQRQHQRQRVLRHRDGVSARRVHHRDAALGGGLEVDVVHAHARAPDHAQLGRLVHHGGVNEHGGAHQQRVGIGQLGGESVFLGSGYGPVGLLLEYGERGGRDFFSDYDFHMSSLCKSLRNANRVEHRFSGANPRLVKVRFRIALTGARL